jgi:hypothetical protein
VNPNVEKLNTIETKIDKKLAKLNFTKGQQSAQVTSKKIDGIESQSLVVKNSEEIKEIEDQLEDLKNICLLNEKTIQQ